MSTPPQNPAGDARTPRFDDPTRNIRLPSLPDRAPSVVRPEWQTHVPPAVADPAPAPGEQPEPSSGDAPAAAATITPAREPSPPRPYALPNEPTDEMSSPPRVRQHTLAFDAPAGAPGAPQLPGSHAPGHGSPQFGAPQFGAPQFGAPPFGPPSGAPGHGTPSYGPPPSHGPGRGVEPGRSRRWPWVVLTVLPILVIVGSGLLLLFLLRGA